MGLMNRLLGRGDAPAASGWHAYAPAVQVCPAGEVPEWDGSGNEAYCVFFQRKDAPCLLTVWVYPVPGPAEGEYTLRFQYERQVEPGPGAEPWTYVDYMDDPDEDWSAMGLRSAQEGARQVAAGLLTRGEASDLPEIFGWDGQPFEIGEG